MTVLGGYSAQQGRLPGSGRMRAFRGLIPFIDLGVRVGACLTGPVRAHARLTGSAMEDAVLTGAIVTAPKLDGEIC